MAINKHTLALFPALLLCLTACVNEPQAEVREIKVVTEVRVEVIVTATPEAKKELHTSTPEILGKVVVDNTILRSGPGHNYKDIEVIYKGELLSIHAKNQDDLWILVYTPIGNKGWVPIKSIKSLDSIEDLEVSDMVITTSTVIPTHTATLSRTPTLPRSTISTPTPKPSATKIVAFVASTTPKNYRESLDYLVNKYEEYVDVYSNLTKSSATGEDVRIAYLTSQEIIKSVTNKKVPSQLEELKSKLVEGISLQAKGFGCLSNTSLCESSMEAKRLLVKGSILLDEFINEINENYD